MSAIKFGTDGWRGVMAREFTFANVAVVTQAIAQYVKGQGLAERGLMVGYDNRFLGNLFAERVAEVLAGNGILVYLCEAPAPTPAVAAEILPRELAGAVMITASHNPAEYNGIKFIPDFAGPATPEITDEITRQVRKVETGMIDVRVTPFARGLREGMIAYDSPRRRYIEQMKRVIDREVIAAAGLRVVIDPMHGAGIGYLEELLQEFHVDVAQCLRNQPDPLFGGDLPEPCAEKLEELASSVQAHGAHLGLALDGDADRFGIIDPSGTYVTPNQVLALLTHYFLTHRTPFARLARTVATTHLVDRIAKAHDAEVVETPVGFKYIGQEIRQGAGIGGEESGGLSIAEHIPEKDGLLVGLLMLEMMAKTRQTPLELLAELNARYGMLYNERVDCRLAQEAKEAILQTMQNWSQERLGDWRIVQKSTMDGVKLTFSTGAWVLVRPSGTEPLVRMYYEANTPEELQALKEQMAVTLSLAV